ncbi:Rab GTPase family protein, partial [Gregarina niphandrodes]
MKSTHNDCDAVLRVILIGDGAVGKSSIMLRYCEDKFDPKHIMTIG